ncbi:MAG: ferredoxin [Candidatus Sericytochromatia bacterium]
MKIKTEPIRADKYLNVSINTYPMEFNILDSLFNDLGNHKFCTVLSDGKQEIIHSYSASKSDALEKHKECYDRLLLRNEQWFDVRKRTFKYISYNEEKIADVTTIDEKTLYNSFVLEAQRIVVKGANNSFSFYTKREATEYSRNVAFALFSGLRVKVGKLKNTSYAALKTNDASNVSAFVKETDMVLANKFLKNMYTQGLEYDKWQMFIDLLEAKISEYYKQDNKNVNSEYIVLEEILKEVEERVALTSKHSATTAGGGGGGQADWNKRYSTNKPGKFYVDDKCIVCDACAQAAPKFFKLNAQHAFVYAQPTTPEEIELCNTALSGCPVAAIGSDGDVMAAAAAAPKAAPKVEVKKEEPKVEAKKEEISADLEKEVENLKNMLSLVPADKIQEIKALLSSIVPEQNTEEVKAEEVVVEAAPAESTPSDAPKPLPAKAPDGSNVYPENVAGLFYVDDKCISCDACAQAAPDFFVINDGHAYVFAQPKNNQEIEACKEAMAGCPVSSINMNL